MSAEETTIEQFAITAEALYTRVLGKQAFVLVDVRSTDLFNPNDFADDSAFEVLHIPYTEFQDDLAGALAKLPQDKESIFICRSGNKTRIVMSILKDLPFKKGWVPGGLGAWRNFYDTRLAAALPSGKIYQIARPGRGDLSYVVIQGAEAVVIDPLRNVALYQDLIEKHNAHLTAIFDTHNHADRISGGRFLAQETGAPYYKHPYDAIHLVDRMPMRAPYMPLWDGDTFQVGTAQLCSIWFPGHTLGMTNFHLATEDGQKFLFTGDGIFIHSIGRPDLMGVDQKWAEMLHESLNTRLTEVFAENPVILPAHFQYFSEQNGEGLFVRHYNDLKQENPYLKPMTQEAFIELILSDIPEAPEEYLEILRINHAMLDVSEDRAKTLEAGKNLCSATILEH